MTGEARLHGDLRGFKVTDLTDHDHVRVLSEDGAQTAGKAHIYAGIHLRLTNAVEVILDGIFHRHDVAGAGIQS